MTIERFLIVDEVEANQLFFSVVLNDMGFKSVFTARNGEDALTEFSRHNAQMVIVAWELPVMSGTVLLQRLRSGKRKHVPSLIYSKRMSEQDLKLTRELGLPDILSLPFDKEKTRATIKGILDREASLSKEELQLRKIEVYLADNKPNEALQLFDAKLKKDGPHYARGQAVLGQIWMMVNQFPKAEEALKAALAKDPNLHDASNNLATVYSKTGRHEEAIALLRKMTDSSPKNIGTMLNLGSAYVDADRHDDAKKTFATVSTIDPDSPALKDEQGKLAFKEGDLPLAAKLLAETRDGDSLARHFNNMAIALTHKTQFDKAIETYENAIKMLSSKAKLHALQYNLGLALAKKGELARSFVALAESYKGEPSFDKAYAALARVSKQMGEKGLSYDKNLAREVNQIRKQTKAAAQPATDGTPGKKSDAA